MGVSRRLAMLGLLMAVLVPRSASAAPILAGSPGAACGALVSETTTNCALFTIDPFAAPALNGQFSFDNDVALFQFVLAVEVMFSAVTSSFAAGGFDPTIGLFNAAGVVVQYTAEGATFPALGADLSDVDFDDALPELLLGPGTYFLALMQYPNSFHVGLDGLDTLGAGFDADDSPDFAGGCSAPDAAQRCSFSVGITATPVVPTARIPEPGSLSLIVLGLSAAALARRRRRIDPRP